MKPRHPLLHGIARAALWLFPLAILALLARAARAIDWREVLATLAGYDAATLVAAMLLTAASYLVYSGYDLAARRYAHHALSTPRVMAIATIAYAFALNIGALVGGTGMRIRMYSHAGLGLAAIGRIVAFAISTNWLGYLLLAGALFASGRVVPPPRFAAGAAGLQVAGFVMLGAALLYLLACHRLHGRMFHLRSHHYRLPPVPLALVQFALATLNWSLMAAIVWVLMPAAADFPTVLGACLLAAVATALAHVPAGLGVLEAVFIAAFGSRIAPPQVLAALLAFRAIYFLVPLLLAAAGYLAIESRGKPAPARVPP